MFRSGLMIILASISLLSISLVSAAQVYKHVDENGNITYTDKPPPNSVLIEVREPNRIEAPAKIEYYTEPAPEVATSYEVKITAPANETVIPKGEGIFSVAAQVSPGLESGANLQLLIDGIEEGEPQRSSSWALSNVYRGTRLLEVVVLDAKGKELARSETITIYVFRPSQNF